MAKRFPFFPSVKSAELRPLLLYTTSNFVNKGISFLLLFYFTRVLTEADFGVLSLFSNAILLLTPVISLGLLQSATADYFKLDKPAFRDLMAGALLLPLLLAVLLFAGSFSFRHLLAARFHFTSLLAATLPLIAWMVFLHELLTILMRNRNQPVHYSLISSGRLLVEIVLAVFLISRCGWGWTGRVTGVAVSYAAVAAYALWYLWRYDYLSGRLRPALVRQELIYGGPIFLFQLGVFLLGASGIYFIEYFTRNLVEVGVYSVAATFASVINVFCIALLQYVQPRLYELLGNQRDHAGALRRLFFRYLAANAGFTLLVLLIVPVVYLFFLKSAYRTGLAYYHWLCLGQFCWAIAYFFISWLLYHKLKKKIVLLAVTAIALAFTANTLLVKAVGSEGAAMASFAVYAAILLLSAFLVRQPMREIARMQPINKEDD
jgi:O-antigen/teichoic acid export membrane protein